MNQRGLTHLENSGNLKMVDVSNKNRTERMARVSGEIQMDPATVELIATNKSHKGNVLEAARLAGIFAAKRTDELIPLCHSINASSIDIKFNLATDRVRIEATVKVEERTGVEMEGFTAVSIALLTIYDMCKAVDRGMVISSLRLLEKQGGASGTYVSPNEQISEAYRG